MALTKGLMNEATTEAGREWLTKGLMNEVTTEVGREWLTRGLMNEATTGAGDGGTMVKEIDDKDRVYVNFCESLSEEETMLITLRDELYAGLWDKMKHDLADRLQGRPYIFKLVNRIEEDLQRIDKLQGYENEHKINLADYA